MRTTGIVVLTEVEVMLAADFEDRWCRISCWYFTAEKFGEARLGDERQRIRRGSKTRTSVKSLSHSGYRMPVIPYSRDLYRVAFL